MISVHIERRWWDDSVAIYIYETHQHTTNVLKLVDGRLEVAETIEKGGTIQKNPTMTVPSEVLKALAEAAIETVPPDRAMENHLKDTIFTRDRLLAIIEKERKV